MVSEGERDVEKLAGGDYQQKREVAARYPFLLSLPFIDRYPVKGSQSKSRILRVLPCANERKEGERRLKACYVEHNTWQEG